MSCLDKIRGDVGRRNLCIRAHAKFAWRASWCIVLLTSSLRAEDDSPAEVNTLRRQNAQQQAIIERQLQLFEEQQRRLEEFSTSSRPTELPPLPKSTVDPSYGLEAKEVTHLGPANPVGSVPSSAEQLRFGYSDGFFLASPEGLKLGAKEIPFLLRVNSRVQMRYSHFESHGPNRDDNNFELERAFLIFSGFAYTPDLAYHIKLDGDSDETEGVDLLDYYVAYDYGHAVLGGDVGRFGVKAGKWKMPFTRARWENGFNLQFTDRSMASEFFDINRSIGVGMFGRFDLFDRAVNWESALFNGLATQRFVPGRAGELDRNLGFATRVYSDIVGDYGKDGEPDLSYHDCPAVRVGAATALTRINKLDGFREFAGPPGLRAVDSGVPIASLLPKGVNEFSVHLYSVDANFKYRGFSLLSEYYFRVLDRFDGAPVGTLFDHGLLLQAGYFIVPQKLELLSRWSRVVGNSGTLGLSDQSADEVAGGIAWYIRGHNVKFVTDLTHLNGAPVNSTNTNIRPGDHGWLLRTQFQFMF